MIGVLAHTLPDLRYFPVQPKERLCELLNLTDLDMLPQRRNAVF